MERYHNEIHWAIFVILFISFIVWDFLSNKPKAHIPNRVKYPKFEQENLDTLNSFKITYNHLQEYIDILNKKLPISSPEVQWERKQVIERAEFLLNLIQVIEFKHDLTKEISLYQMNFYIAAANNITQRKITLQEILDGPPIPEQGTNTVILDYVQRAINKEKLQNLTNNKQKLLDEYEKRHGFRKEPKSSGTSSAEHEINKLSQIKPDKKDDDEFGLYEDERAG